MASVETNRKRRARLLVVGLCVRCGEHPHVEGITLCAHCRADKSRERRQRTEASARAAGRTARPHRPKVKAPRRRREPSAGFRPGPDGTLYPSLLGALQATCGWCGREFRACLCMTRADPGPPVTDARPMDRMCSCGYALAEPGRRRCAECREARSNRALYAKRRDAGACLTCGRPALAGRARCAACLDTNRAAQGQSRATGGQDAHSGAGGPVRDVRAGARRFNRVASLEALRRAAGFRPCICL